MDELKYTIITGAYPNRNQAIKARGLFETEEEAIAYARKKNYGPDGWKVIPVYLNLPV